LTSVVRSTISEEKLKNKTRLALEARENERNRRQFLKERLVEQRQQRFGKSPSMPWAPWGQKGEQLKESAEYVECQRRLDETLSPTVSPRSRRAAKRAQLKLRLGDPDLMALGERHTAAMREEEGEEEEVGYLFRLTEVTLQKSFYGRDWDPNKEDAYGAAVAEKKVDTSQSDLEVLATATPEERSALHPRGARLQAQMTSLNFASAPPVGGTAGGKKAIEMSEAVRQKELHRQAAALRMQAAHKKLQAAEAEKKEAEAAEAQQRKLVRAMETILQAFQFAVHGVMGLRLALWKQNFQDWKVERRRKKPKGAQGNKLRNKYAGLRKRSGAAFSK